MNQREKKVFKLSNSDVFVGDYIEIRDLAEILDVKQEHLGSFEQLLIDKGLIDDKLSGLIDEGQFRKYRESYLWQYVVENMSNESLYKQSSFDEYILKTIIRRTYPEIEIERQIPLNGSKKRADFKLTLQGESKIVEYMGPGHFFADYRQSNENPLDRKKYVSEVTGLETIIWPYWIQRCETNVKAIFDKTIVGLGALWGTKYHFGAFKGKDSAKLIIELTERFNAVSEKGVGYFYECNSRNREMQEHPLVTKIKDGKASYLDLVPESGKGNPEFWLPHELWKFINH